MSIPHYINEDKSDMRGIKPGWYAMEDNGKLSSGPFSSRHECLSRDLRKQMAQARSMWVNGRIEAIPCRSALRGAGPEIRPVTTP
jgi:hypothetical protein